MSSAEQQLSAVFRDVLQYRDALPAELTPAEVPAWDSVAHISLVESIEAEFGVQLSTDEMIEMNRLSVIRATLARHGVALGPS